MFFSLRYCITPSAASRPKALPPLIVTAFIACTIFSGLKRSVSLVAGPPPLTSTPAAAPFSHIITVQPVPFSISCAFPILKSAISDMLISLIVISYAIICTAIIRAIITPTIASPPRSPAAIIEPVPFCSNDGTALSVINLIRPPTNAVAER